MMSAAVSSGAITIVRMPGCNSRASATIAKSLAANVVGERHHHIERAGP